MTPVPLTPQPDRPAAADDSEALRRQLVLEQLRRQVYESVARRELLAHTLDSLVEMLEQQSSRWAACAVVTADLRADADGTTAAPPTAATTFCGRNGAKYVDLALNATPFPAATQLFSIQNQTRWILPLASGPNAGRQPGVLVLIGPDGATPNQAEKAVAELAVELAAFAVECALNAAVEARRSMIDPLTDLPNASLLQDRLSQAIEVGHRQATQVALLVIEVDGLRLINESLGRPSGDDMLRQLSTRLRRAVRRSDTVARIGGNKLAVVAAVGNGRRDAATLAYKVMAAMTTPAVLGGRELALAANIGIGLFPDDANDPAALLSAGEMALHQARQGGRSTLQFFTAEQHECRLADLEMEGHLRRAIDFALMSQAMGSKDQSGCCVAGRLELHYQPQVIPVERADVAAGPQSGIMGISLEAQAATTVAAPGGGRIVGVEALARWTHPTLGRIPPNQFIAIAERNGIIVQLGRWVLHEAARQAAAWRQQFGPAAPRVAVNVSAMQFASDSFVNDVATVLSKHGLPPGSLELELTETVLMQDAEEAARRIADLRKMGLSIAVDDFGTGYSSLAYLHRLTIDTLKIDRSFVSGLHATRRPPGGEAAGAAKSGAAVIRAIVSLGRSLGMTVLAEGVETVAQQLLLTRIGCEQAQGYLYSPPIPAEKLTRMLEAGGVVETDVPLAATA